MRESVVYEASRSAEPTLQRRNTDVGGGGRVAEVATGSYLPPMRAVGLKTLKNKLSEYVRLAAGGETVLITNRDQVVAELIPPQPGRAVGLQDALLADAVRLGWLTPPVRAGLEPLPRRPVAPLKEILEELDADRADR